MELLWLNFEPNLHCWILTQHRDYVEYDLKKISQPVSEWYPSFAAIGYLLLNNVIPKGPTGWIFSWKFARRSTILTQKIGLIYIDHTINSNGKISCIFIHFGLYFQMELPGIMYSNIFRQAKNCHITPIFRAIQIYFANM